MGGSAAERAADVYSRLVGRDTATVSASALAAAFRRAGMAFTRQQAAAEALASADASGRGALSRGDWSRFAKQHATVVDCLYVRLRDGDEAEQRRMQRVEPAVSEEAVGGCVGVSGAGSAADFFRDSARLVRSAADRVSSRRAAAGAEAVAALRDIADGIESHAAQRRW
eukprot:TRINITY_DN17423_c0_g1_i3.p2 TRINITY_DN17423_c0_g1~~TRINITY_DN17423_c0_g1_i3.p2  ORF type:complete len:169 (+),score=44.46 TRINITY_DN17423_c0_g1_i3:389-895(+)